LSGVLLTVYFHTMPRSIVMEDTSIFVMASHYLGTAHPPGYPLVVLTGKLFSYLPIGSPAFRIHLVSAFYAVLTCSALYLTARLLSISRLAATTGAIGLGLSQAFWSQAIIAEAELTRTLDPVMALPKPLSHACAQIGALFPLWSVTVRLDGCVESKK
jgi:hypothetical protein